MNSEINRVLWACRRGMLELDVFLIPFAQNNYLQLSKAEKNSFKKLLNEPDPVLYAWLMNSEVSDNAEFQLMIKKIQDYAARRS